MNKTLSILLLIVLITAVSGCIQTSQPSVDGSETAAPAAEATSEVGGQAQTAPAAEAKATEAKEPVAEWCTPSELNIFSNFFIPVKAVSIIISKDYDPDFGPDAVDKLFVGDAFSGYAKVTLPDPVKYSDLVIEGRAVNSGSVMERTPLVEDNLLKYGDYYYQYWDNFRATEAGTAKFEVKLTYLIPGNVSRTQCESFEVPVYEVGTTDVTDFIDFSQVAYSRSRIFEFKGNFTETLYNNVSRVFSASIVAQNIANPELKTEVALTNIDKIVCMQNSCVFKSEANLPRSYLGNFTPYDQWCSSSFKRTFQFNRGNAQPMSADLTDKVLTGMCNKLQVGI